MSRSALAVLLASSLLLPACGGNAPNGGDTVAANPADPDAQVTSTTTNGPPIAPVAVKAVSVASGFTSPWSFAFLPDGRIVVAEKGGTLRILDRAGRISAALAGVPAVRAGGQGGLLDVVLGPDFSVDRRIYFSFSEPLGAGTSRTAVARAVLGETAVTDVTVIYRQTPALSSEVHFGSRLVFDRAGHLFVTLGERGGSTEAQNLQTTQGKVVKIEANGAVPSDNPASPGRSTLDAPPAADPAFGQPGVLPEIWSFGHRNPQGAALHPVTGELWLSEHGPRGGDEINRARRGRNYGWPRITHGRDYSTGEPLGEGTSAADVEPPVHFWVPVSVAPSGIAFQTGDKLPGWQGSLLVATLAGQSLVRLDLAGNTVVGETRHLQSLQSRIRDVRHGPDGYPYVLTDDGKLYRVEPQ